MDDTWLRPASGSPKKAAHFLVGPNNPCAPPGRMAVLLVLLCYLDCGARGLGGSGARGNDGRPLPPRLRRSGEKRLTLWCQAELFALILQF